MNFASSPSVSLDVDNYGLQFVTSFCLESSGSGLGTRKRRREDNLLGDESLWKCRKIGFMNSPSCLSCNS